MARVVSPGALSACLDIIHASSVRPFVTKSTRCVCRVCASAFQSVGARHAEQTLVPQRLVSDTVAVSAFKSLRRTVECYTLIVIAIFVVFFFYR